MTLLEMPINIKMGNDITRDIHCDVRMSYNVAMCTSQYIMTLLLTSFIMYYAYL